MEPALRIGTEPLKRVLFGVLGLALVLMGVGYAFRGQIATRLMANVIESHFSTNLRLDLPDGLHVALCGAGSPLPDLNRSGPCAAVIAGGRLFVVDSGSGSSRVLGRMRIPQGEIEAIFLTHFHSDHIDGLGELLVQRWVNGTNTSPVPVYGPEGVTEVVDGINLAYQASRSYRVAHHGEEIAPSSGAGAAAKPFPSPADGVEEIIIDEHDLRIAAFRVEHSPVEPSVGYRFDYKDRSVVLTGDTAKSANVEKFARGVDLLVHDALAPQLVSLMTQGAAAAGRENLATITRDVLDYHATPVEAASIAQAAGVGHLLYYHIVPPLPLAALEDRFVEGVEEVYDGPVTVGRDGTLVRLDAGSDSIQVIELL